MLHRSVRLAYLLCVTLGALLAILGFHAFDEFVPTDADYQVRVDQPMTTGTASDVHTAVDALARDTGVDIAKHVADVRRPEHVMHFYAAVGRSDGEVADRIAHGYRGFSRNTDVRYHPLDELDTADPRGYYVVWGDEDDANRLLEELRAFGMDGFVSPMPTGTMAAGSFIIGTPLGSAYGIAALAIVVLAGSGVLMTAPGYGVQRLQGRPYGRILARDLRELGPTAGFGLAGVAALLAAGLGLYNGYARLDDFSVALVVFVGVLAVLCLLSHVVALALLFRAPILDAVKGRFAARWATVATYAVRIPATALTVLVAFACVQGAVQLEERRTAHEAWENVEEAAYLLVSGTADALDDPTFFPRLGAMTREALAEGDAVLVGDVSRDMVPADVAAGPFVIPDLSCPVLRVSPSYLAKQPVTAGDGTRIRDVAAGRVTVLKSPTCGDDVADGIERFLASGADASDSPPPTIVNRELAAGQSFFTYGDKWGSDENLWAHDAALVVVPSDAAVISDDFYGSFASTGEVFFASQDVVFDRAAEAGLGDQINGAFLLTQAAADQTRRISQDFRTTTTSLLAAIGVLIVTALALVAMHTRSRGQEIYVRYISGWTFWRTAWPLALVEACLAVLVVIWAVGRGAEFASQPGVADALRTDVTLWYGAIACASAVAGGLLVLFLLRGAVTRVVRSRSADA